MITEDRLRQIETTIQADAEADDRHVWCAVYVEELVAAVRQLKDGAP